MTTINFASGIYKCKHVHFLNTDAAMLLWWKYYDLWTYKLIMTKNGKNKAYNIT